MKLSMATGYAVRALTHLARHDGDRPVTAAVMAQAEGVPPKFIGKILRQLVAAAVLRGTKGPNGGYRLARPAKGITLLEVAEAVDGPLRGDVPRWALAAAEKLDDRLQGVIDAATAATRERLGKVTVAQLAGGKA
jgi:Rrf2 family protein